MTKQLFDKHGNPRVGAYIHTSNGMKFWPFDPKPEEVYIEVIAQHLSTECRWNGAVQHKIFPTRNFYSVAEHSVYCSYMVPEEDELEALLHDAPEAITGDMIRPLKYSPQIYPIFKQLEDLSEVAIAERFGMRLPLPKSVKLADEMVCEAEAQQIVCRDPEDEWETGLCHDRSKVAPIRIEMMSPYDAKVFFLARFYEIAAKRNIPGVVIPTQKPIATMAPA